MYQQQASTIPALFGASEPLPEKRVCKATTRFQESWFSEKLPRLSSALGVGVAASDNARRAVAQTEALQRDDKESSISDSQAHDETRSPSAIGENQELTEVDTSETLPSKRVRKATTRFQEGWYSEKLPRLSAALGVAVASG